MALETMRLSAIVGIAGCRPCGQVGGRPGRLLGPYRLLARVGAGAYAVVYLGRHEVMGVERAIKVLREPEAARQEQRDRFLREARVAARLRHPNVVSVYDCGVAPDGTPYIVMEHVAGRSLADRLRDGVPPAAETLRIAGQLAAALDHAHGMGVVHRDVKPANVLLGRDGAVRLGDFGIAHAEREPSGGGETWARLGTPAYMAPEQCLGRPAGARSDVYALAAVIYEMLTGRLPHGEKGIGGAGPRPLPLPRTVDPRLPAAVDAVLAGGLAWDAQHRPSSAGGLAAALAAALAPDAPAPDRPTAEPPLPRDARPAGPAGPAVPASTGRRGRRLAPVWRGWRT